MSNKRKGQLTVSHEWAKHLRPFLRRVFWKGERRAAKAAVGKEDLASTPATAVHVTVEELLFQIQSMPAGTTSLELWVPDQLTLGSQDVPREMAMALVVDHAREQGLSPDGHRPAPGGRFYRFQANESAPPRGL